MKDTLKFIFRKGLCFLAFACFAVAGAWPAAASELTHLLGTTGYMIREAKQAGAAKKDPENYAQAVALQKKARQAFRGEGDYRRKFRRKGRNREEALNLTREAYLLAKQARDNSDPERYAGSKDLFYRSVGK